jgi:uncharacterized Zn finger protein
MTNTHSNRCPICSPSMELDHTILHTTKDTLTLQCPNCNYVYKNHIPSPKLINCNVIVSQHEDSLSTTIPLSQDTILQLGDEFIVDTEDAIFVVTITSLESLSSAKRVTKTTAQNVKTIWTRAIDNVYVNVTIHSLGSERHQSRSMKFGVPGDYLFEIGKITTLDNSSFLIEGIHLRQDLQNNPVPKLKNRGEAALAKDIKRIYASEPKYSISYR